jgi:hypothetical protein
MFSTASWKVSTTFKNETGLSPLKEIFNNQNHIWECEPRNNNHNPPNTDRRRRGYILIIVESPFYCPKILNIFRFAYWFVDYVYDVCCVIVVLSPNSYYVSIDELDDQTEPIASYKPKRRVYFTSNEDNSLLRQYIALRIQDLSRPTIDWTKIGTQVQF